MSAYTNPETYIDTQSAQYLQNLQSTIAGSFAKVAQSYASRQEELKKEKEENQKILRANDMKAQEYSFSLYTDLAKAGEGDKSVDWAKTFDPLIKESVALRSGLLNGTLPDNQRAIKRLAQIQSSVDGVTGSLANLSAAGSTYKEALDKGVSAQGGLSSWNDPKITLAMDVLTQRLPGNKEPFFKDNDPSKLMWRVTDNSGGLLYEFDASQLDKISKGQGLIKTIPNQIEAFDTLKTTNNNIFETTQTKVGGKEVAMPNGKINTLFLKPDQKEVVVAQSEGKKVTKLIQEVDFDLIRKEAKDGNLGVTLASQANGMLANQSSAIDFYNDIISDDRGAYKGTGFNFDPRRPLTPADQQKFVEDYKEYFIKTQIAKTQDVIKPGEDAFTTTYETPKPTKTKGVSATGTQKNQADFNREIATKVKNGGVIKGKGGLYLDVKNGVGTVYKIDSSGLKIPIESEGDTLEDMISQIGGTGRTK